MKSGAIVDQAAPSMPLTCSKAIVAGYRSHDAAETAIRLLAKDGLPMDQISIIGRNFETREDVQGFYRPADAARDGAVAGAWFGGLFGLLLGTGLFILPVIGPVFVLGPLAGLVAGSIGGAGVGALVSGLVSLGVPRDRALKYQGRVQGGEFLVVVHGTTTEDTERACAALEDTTPIDLQTHVIFYGGQSERRVAAGEDVCSPTSYSPRMAPRKRSKTKVPSHVPSCPSRGVRPGGGAGLRGK